MSYFWPHYLVSVAFKGQKLRIFWFILALKPTGRILNQSPWVTKLGRLNFPLKSKEETQLMVAWALKNEKPSSYSTTQVGNFHIRPFNNPGVTNKQSRVVLASFIDFFNLT